METPRLINHHQQQQYRTTQEVKHTHSQVGGFWQGGVSKHNKVETLKWCVSVSDLLGRFMGMNAPPEVRMPIRESRKRTRDFTIQDGGVYWYTTRPLGNDVTPEWDRKVPTWNSRKNSDI